jgi:hypothetical protein
MFGSIHFMFNLEADSNASNSELLYYKTVDLLKNLAADANIKIKNFQFYIVYCIIDDINF